MADTTDYLCKRRVRHNGKDYKAGKLIPLTPEEARDLVELGVLVLAKNAPAEGADSEDTGGEADQDTGKVGKADPAPAPAASEATGAPAKAKAGKAKE